MNQCSGYVLSGGASSRFGSDKALVAIAGRPLIQVVADAVESAAGNVTLVGAPEKYAHLGRRVIPDPISGIGPLAGLLGALRDSSSQSSPWSLIAACDMPFLSREFLTFLIGRSESSAADVLLPVDSEGRDEPLCALYAADCLGALEQAADSGVRKITRALNGLRIERLPPPDYARFDPDGRLFANLNTPEDFERSGLKLG